MECLAGALIAVLLVCWVAWLFRRICFRKFNGRRHCRLHSTVSSLLGVSSRRFGLALAWRRRLRARARLPPTPLAKKKQRSCSHTPTGSGRIWERMSGVSSSSFSSWSSAPPSSWSWTLVVCVVYSSCRGDGGRGSYQLVTTAYRHY